MTADIKGNQQDDVIALGDLLHDARLTAGLTSSKLAELSGVAKGQISKLERGQVAKPNPAHLAALAEALDLSLWHVYRTAGYRTPESLLELTPDLEEKLRLLPPERLGQLEAYVEQLLTDPAPVLDEISN